jgi:hypothetical protein
MEPTRRGEGPLDRLVGDPVVQRIEEPDIFAGVGNISRNTLERSRHPGEVGPIVDDRNYPCGRVQIANPQIA